jgi:hypothetical protein
MRPNTLTTVGITPLISTFALAALVSCGSSPSSYYYAGDGGLAAGGGGPGGSSGCTGALGCACYGNGTCDNTGLTCKSNLCVSLTGADGGTNTGGAGGGTNTGGAGGGTNTGGAGGGTNTGGGIGTGGAGGTGGSTGGFANDGYVTSGAWHGYAYTGFFPTATTTVSISPACKLITDPCFETSGSRLCVNGRVPGDATGQSGAFVGFNVNQVNTVGAAALSVVTSGAGLSVSVTGTPASGLRVTLAADSAGAVTYCANLPLGGTGTIPWSQFNTACWEPATGVYFSAGKSIVAVQITIPSAATSTSFDFCLTNAAQN